MTENEPTKICSKCQIEKPLSAFYKDRNAKDDLRNPCKVCDKKISSEYRGLSSKEKDERVSERQRIRKAKKQKKIRLDYIKKQHQKEREENLKAYRDANKVKRSKYDRKRYQANKEKLKAQSRARKAANPDKVLAYRNALNAHREEEQK